jgi:hypothetical protein
MALLMQTFDVHRRQFPKRPNSLHPSIMAGDTSERGYSFLDCFRAVLLDPSYIKQEILPTYVRLTEMLDQTNGMIVNPVCGVDLVLRTSAHLYRIQTWPPDAR